MSKNFFIWDMIFEGFDGRGDSLTEVLAGLAIRFIWRLSVGAVIALVDFLIRLPFYLREYEVYKIVPVADIDSALNSRPQYIPPPAYNPNSDSDSSDDSGSEETLRGETPKHEGAKQRRTEQHQQQQYTGGFERQGAPRARLHAYVFFVIAALGAIGATTLLLFVIWSPCLLLLGFVWRNNRHRRQHGDAHYD
jgi:hypothetical protein